MLTKDTLRFRVVSGNIKPKFIEVADADYLNFAEQLLSVYNPEQELLRGELDEAVEPLIKAHKDLKFSKGLNKLILDRCEFSNPTEFDYLEERKKIFLKSSALLKNPFGNDLELYRESIGSESAEFVRAGIYSDLPENETLIKVKVLYSKELLERYNCSLVQSLLLHCQQLELRLDKPEAAELRRLFKYLKFFRLLAEVKVEKSGKLKAEKKWSGEGDKLPERIEIQVDGPMSLFENTQKYGLQLASFFPAICALKKWKLKAEIKLDGRELTLKVDEKSKLVSHYRNFSAYVPEEIAMFHKLFKEKITAWEITGNSPFLITGDGKIIFPDLSFQSGDGRLVHLELFHRWHSTPLLERLELCAENSDLDLIIGVDRSLYKRPEIKKALDRSEWFEQNGFLFRDFPGVDRVAKLLAQKTGNRDGVDQGHFNF
jgi:predicted nuclease of restriction endonuclease-like RecB superfamily